MINVYDWFDSFSQALDSKEEGEREVLSPKKRLGKGKGKAVVETTPGDDQDEECGQGDQNTWQREVQARFIRSIHELDFLGFLKHTGRKADHVMKTVFDIPD